MNKQISLSQAIEGFLLAKSAEGKSHYTIRNYTLDLNRLTSFLGDDPPFTAITTDDLRRFLSYLQDEYVPDPQNSSRRLSAKTVRNTYITLSSFWTWAEKEFEARHVVRPIAIPEAPEKVIEPLTREEVEALLDACKYTKPWENRPGTRTRRATYIRDRAIVLFLLDTGVRAQEFCEVTIGEANLKTGKVKVAGKALGRGSKERIVYLGKSARRATWRYLQTREWRRPDDPLFATGSDERQFERNVLRRLLNRMGERAGLSKSVYPHRFRHTFAINFLRNGGNLFELQRLLGHTSLKMVMRYARIAESDTEAAHRQASPVDNWRL